jgi:peptidoglycan/LPS O-acetylase OafA/YrhL
VTATTYSRDDFIDLLRGLAILLVVVYHALGIAFPTEHLQWGSGLFPDFNVSHSFLLLLPATLGWSGVAIFFAISGFCIHSSYTRERHLGVTRYLIKRTFRIYPPYFISLCFFSFWLATYGHGVLLPNFLLHVLLIHNFSADYYYGINLAYWSIAVEFQLYLLYIPLIFIKNKVGWKATIAIVFLLEICLRSVEAYELIRFGEISIWVAGCPFTYIFSWSIGALIADINLRERLANQNKWWIPITIVIGIGSQFIKPASTFGFMIFAISSAMMISYVQHHNIQTNWRIGRLIPLGVVSYSVYLIHQPIIQFVPRVYHYFLTFEIQPLVVFVTCVCMVVPIFWCSLIMRKVVELPSVNMGYRLLAIRGAASKAAPNTPGVGAQEPALRIQRVALRKIGSIRCARKPPLVVVKNG